MGILVTGASIVVMCTAGIAVSTVFKWLHTYEMDLSRKDNNPRHRGHEERLNSMASRPRNMK